MTSVHHDADGFHLGDAAGVAAGEAVAGVSGNGHVYPSASAGQSTVLEWPAVTGTMRWSPAKSFGVRVKVTTFCPSLPSASLTSHAPQGAKVVVERPVLLHENHDMLEIGDRAGAVTGLRRRGGRGRPGDSAELRARDRHSGGGRAAQEEPAARDGGLERCPGPVVGKESGVVPSLRLPMSMSSVSSQQWRDEAIQGNAAPQHNGPKGDVLAKDE